MATTRKSLRESVKASYVEMLSSLFAEKGEDVLRVGSNELAFPVVDSEGNEDWLVLTVKIPTGGRDGDAYDGYAMAEDYRMKCAEKARKAEESAKVKTEKIERDRKAREDKTKAKEKVGE